jgi:hypothetical protein
MNNISKSVIMNNRSLVMYTDYLLNKCYQFKNNNAVAKTGTAPGANTCTVPIAVFCSVYCDDCNGTCMNSKYSLLKNVKLAALAALATPAKPVLECSKLCNDNVYNDCICL